MPRKPSIWKRKGRDGWWTTIAGRQVRLPDDYKQAKEESSKLRTVKRRIVSVSIQESVDQFLHSVKDTTRPTTWASYEWYLQKLCNFAGQVPASSLSSNDLTKWMLARQWGTSTRHLAVSIAKLWGNWAAQQGHAPENPFKGIRRPRMARREPVRPEAMAAFVAAINSDELRDFVIVLLETGCRPGEVRTLDASSIDWDASTAIVRGKCGPRLVCLTARTMAILTRLRALYPDGPLLRNLAGAPWTIHRLGLHFRRTSERAGGIGVVPYHCRHAFWGRARKAGVDSVVIARQMGHKDLTMLLQTYADVEIEMMRAAVESAAI